ncbi:hypothetical protein IFM89_011978 [Coptis chinensis]|uniref:Transmembrane protein n=1 Tax=Coptis chinensis TaxID=261450 RepID=A0A835M4N7_9MAGN|nr:hypothetical protein IFM89_011978 [Coptis chinensis]
MLFSKTVSLLLLPSLLLLLIFSLVCTSCNGVSQQTHQFGFKHEQGFIDGEEYGEVGMRRFLAEGNETTENGSGFNSTLILAAKRTYRRDPLDNFKRYTGGWNISELHYWASVGFTAAPFFVIALAWFAIFGLSLFCICCCYCCCRREPYGYSRTAYALSLIFLILFTIAAIVGCIVLYTGQGKFHGSTGDTLEYIVKQSNVTVDNLRNVSDYLSAAKRVGVVRFFLGPDVQTSIDVIDAKINSSSSKLADKTKENSQNIKDVLNTVRLCLIPIAAVMLLLTFLGF